MVKKNVCEEYSSIRIVSTLSPIPGFNQWLGTVSLTEKLSPSQQQMVAEAVADVEADIPKENSATSKLAYLLQNHPAKLLLDDARAVKLKEPVRFGLE